MAKRQTFLPIMLVMMVALVGAFVALSGGSKHDDVTVNDRYPHHICTFNRYCAGNACAENVPSFVAYTMYEDGHARLEFPNMSPRATLTEDPEGIALLSTGGALEGTLRIFRTNGLDFTGTSGSGDDLVQHFASGNCTPLIEP